MNIQNIFISYDITDYIELNDKSIKIYMCQKNNLVFINAINIKTSDLYELDNKIKEKFPILNHYNMQDVYGNLKLFVYSGSELDIIDMSNFNKTYIINDAIIIKNNRYNMLYNDQFVKHDLEYISAFFRDYKLVDTINACDIIICDNKNKLNRIIFLKDI